MKLPNTNLRDVLVTAMSGLIAVGVLLIGLAVVVGSAWRTFRWAAGF